MTDKKFSATDWKNQIETDITEIKKALFGFNQFLGIFEQWRRLPFNNQNGVNDETNTRGNNENERKETKSYGTKRPSAGKKGSNKNVARKSRRKTKKS